MDFLLGMVDFLAPLRELCEFYECYLSVNFNDFFLCDENVSMLCSLFADSFLELLLYSLDLLLTSFLILFSTLLIMAWF